MTEVLPPQRDENLPINTPENLQMALANMRDKRYLKTARYGEQQHRANRRLAQDQILVFEKRLVKEMAKLGVPMFAHEIYRTKERQKALFDAKRTKLLDGAHMRGAAVDIIHSIKGWELTRQQWSLIGHVGKEIAKRLGIHLVWGGDWNFYDPAHWELKNWRELPPF